MAHRGMKVGANINTDTNRDLKLTSKYDSSKVFKWGDLTLSPDGGGDDIITIPHNLGYAVAARVFRKGTAQYTFMDGSSHTDCWFPIGGTNRWSFGDEAAGIFCYTDDTNLYIQTLGVVKAAFTIRYYLLVDKVEAFDSLSNVEVTGDRGMKFTASPNNVLTSPEQNLGFSTKFKSLQYFRESLASQSMTLPPMWTSPIDEYVEEGTYIDFYHGLGYPPLFEAFFLVGSVYRELPFSQFTNVIDAAGLPFSTTITSLEIASFCDDEKIRVSFWRQVYWDKDSDTSSNYFDTETITVKVVPFAENLFGANYGE